MKKYKVQIIFLQETHMSKNKHEKLKKFKLWKQPGERCGYADLQLSQFDWIMEKSDTQGRYIIIKGRIDNILVTFANVYMHLQRKKEHCLSLYSAL